MMLLENEHRTQADSAVSTTANIDTDALRLLQELVSAGAVKRDEGSPALATQVHELAGVLLRKTFDTRVEVVTDLGSVVDEIQALDLLDDGAEDERVGWVAHPCVELAVWLVGSELWVAEVVAGGLGFLAEGYHVGRGLEIPVFVCPELAGGADAGLHLVNDQEDVMFLCEGTQAAEEGWRGVVVAALGLDRLDDHGAGWKGMGSD